MGDVTRLIQQLSQGDAQAEQQLLAAVYEELRRVAASKLAQERAGHTLQATALVHEAYLRLQIGKLGQWENRAHFFAAAAEAMRRILIDSARRKARQKHGGQKIQQPFSEGDAVVSPADSVDILALNEALEKLEIEDKTKADLVKLRYFTGLTVEEAGRVLGISRATADRYWTFARSWLFRELSR
jgi:RNA polymerase sigma factor (TIGR02999 family)